MFGLFAAIAAGVAAVAGIGKAIYDKVTDSSSYSSYTPRSNNTADSTKKNADELEDMKKKMKANAAEIENSILEEIGTLKINKVAEINVAEINRNLQNLKSIVKGFLGRCYDNELVMTNSKLSEIFKEKDDKKRKKDFDNFCKNMQITATEKLKSQIFKMINEQINYVSNELNARLNEIEIEVKRIDTEYEETLKALKENDEEKLQQKRMENIYIEGLCDLILDECKSYN